MSLYHKLVPASAPHMSSQTKNYLRHKPSFVPTEDDALPSRSQTPASPNPDSITRTQHVPSFTSEQGADANTSSSSTRHISYAPPPPALSGASPSFTPILESVDHAIKDTGLQPMRLPEHMTTDDFTRAVAVATVSALRHQQVHHPVRVRSGVLGETADDEGAHGGHDAPSWSRLTSASVLLACTALYAVIAGTCRPFL